MKAEAERGLDWRAEYNRGGTLVGVSRARDISNGRKLPFRTVQRMVSYFARHEVDKQGEGFSPGEDGYPSAGRIAWALWGGDAGQSWANNISQNADRQADEDREIIDMKELETRSLPMGDFTVTEGEDGQKTFSGYAALFNTPSQGMPFTEVIAPDAFTRTLKRTENNKKIISFLFGHDETRALATTASGRLNLTQDARGLKVEAKLDPADPDAASVISKLTYEARSMGMSFGFSIPKNGDVWEENVRTLKEINLFEVSVLSAGQTPAYPSTIGLTAVRKVSADKLGVDGDRLMNTLESIKSAQPLTEDDVQLLDQVRERLAPKPVGIHASVAIALLETKKLIEEVL
jgi:HK97 family phage prohead protease